MTANQTYHLGDASATEALVLVYCGVMAVDEARLRQQISEARFERAMRYKSAADRARHLIGNVLLRRAVGELTGHEKTLEIEYSPLGKPYLKNVSGLEFSLSHCGEAVACAVTRGTPIGVDIETIQPIDTDVINFCCSDTEKQQILSSDNPAATFAQIWTHKESLAKLRGTGLQGDLRAIPGIGLQGDLRAVQPTSLTFKTPTLVLTLSGSPSARLTLTQTL